MVLVFVATNALWLDSVSFLFSAALVAFVVPRPAAPAGREEPRPFLRELVDGLRFVWSRRLLRALVLTVLVTNLLDAPFPVIMAVFAQAAYGSAADLGLMYGTLGAAALVGALLYSSIGHRLPRRRTFVCCFAVFPVTYLTIATQPSLPVALLALAIGGLASGPVNPLLFTVISEVVPVELRGRVFGAVRGGAWASIPLGILIGGVLVESVGVTATFLGIGVCYALVVSYGFINPAFGELDSA
jgi:MFS family permease